MLGHFRAVQITIVWKQLIKQDKLCEALSALLMMSMRLMQNTTYSVPSSAYRNARLAGNIAGQVRKCLRLHKYVLRHPLKSACLARCSDFSESLCASAMLFQILGSDIAANCP